MHHTMVVEDQDVSGHELHGRQVRIKRPFRSLEGKACVRVDGGHIDAIDHYLWAMRSVTEYRDDIRPCSWIEHGELRRG